MTDTFGYVKTEPVGYNLRISFNNLTHLYQFVAFQRVVGITIIAVTKMAKLIMIIDFFFFISQLVKRLYHNLSNFLYFFFLSDEGIK